MPATICRGEKVEAVATALPMLRDELPAVRGNKAEHNQRLRRRLQKQSNGRSNFKHAIGAVMPAGRHTA